MKKIVIGLFLVLTSALFSQPALFEKILQYPDSINKFSAAQLSDSSFILASHQRYYLRIIKISNNGDVLWKKDFSTDFINQDASSHLCATNDGGFMVTGAKFYNKLEQIVLQKFDSAGTVVWEKVFGDTTLREIGIEILQTSDNGFLLTAGIKYGYMRPILIKVDSVGNQLWRKDFPNDVSNSSLGYRLRKVDDTTFVFSKYKSLTFFTEGGETTDSIKFNKEIISFAVNEKKELAVAFDSSLAFYSSEKNKLWEVPFNEAMTSYLVFAIDGNIINAQSGKSYYLRKYSLDGSLVWERWQLMKPGFVIGTFDSCYFITGETYQKKLVVKKVNINGAIKRFNYPVIPNYIFPSTLSRLSWSGEDVSTVDIYLSLDSAKTWTLLGDNITDNNFWWTTPVITYQHCFFKLVDSYDPRFSVISTMFSINNQFSFSGQTIETNNLLYWFSKDGISGFDPLTGGGGLYWPKSSGVTAVFQDGFLWAGKVNGQIRANGSAYRTGLVPGTINSDGTRSDTTNPKFKIWKIRRDYAQLPDSIKAQYANEYNHWPGELGAPFIDENHDGIFSSGIDKPFFLGDETAFFVTNDLDTTQSKFFTGTNPIGIEMQQTLYAYKTYDYLDNIVFKNIRIINKSSNTVDSMYVGYWTDVDLGEANDDYVGCDSSTNLGYIFNSTDFDNSYGAAPPAIGYEFLKGVLLKGNETDSAYVDGAWKKGFKDLGLSVYVPIFKNYWAAPKDWSQGTPQGAMELHNILSGKLNLGTPFINLSTNQPFGNYPFSGDPETKTGVYEGGPLGLPISAYDRRFIISSGPFTFAPGDTQNVTVAIFLVRGTSNVNSVTKLKETAKLITSFYNQHLSDVEKDEQVLPEQFALYQNYPNPFNPETVISYQLAVNSKVSLKVYDILGKEVAILVNEEKSAGKYQVNFNTQRTTNSAFGGKQLASGVYFYQLRAGQFVQTKKFVVLK
jgi:hypothetical protein